MVSKSPKLMSNSINNALFKETISIICLFLVKKYKHIKNLLLLNFYKISNNLPLNIKTIGPIKVPK